MPQQPDNPHAPSPAALAVELAQLAVDLQHANGRIDRLRAELLGLADRVSANEAAAAARLWDLERRAAGDRP